MQVLKLGEIIKQEKKSIVSVGNFDGVHRGHRHLLTTIVSQAKQKHMWSVVLTFEPHTRFILNPDKPFEILTNFNEKVHLIALAGIDYVVQIPFTISFSELTPEEFIRSILIKQLNAQEWAMGEGHGIGKGRTGTKNFLHKLLSKYHIISFTADLLMQQKTIVSSTQIRENITAGRIVEAVEMLGHPYLISTVRIEGLKIGSQLGFPTLNFARPPSQKVLPPPGVYTAELEYKDQKQAGALYFGDCPTFADRTTHFEFHALNADHVFPEVGEEVRLWLHTFIRNDRTFATKEALAAQIDIDVKTIKNFFRGEGSCH